MPVAASPRHAPGAVPALRRPGALERLVGAVTTGPPPRLHSKASPLRTEATEQEALGGPGGRCQRLGGRSPGRSLRAPGAAAPSPGRLPEPRRPGAFPGITCPGLEGDTIAKKSVTKDLTKAAIFPF